MGYPQNPPQSTTPNTGLIDTPLFRDILLL
jgi:hypothetical protein